jgi:hypothetical protein
MFMSAQLIDILQKIVCKDFKRRITLDEIKNDPWFSQTEYQALLDVSRAEARTGQDAGIQREILDKITRRGYDCGELQNALLARNFTNLTALYRITLRQRQEGMIKDIMQPVGQQRQARPRTKQLPSGPISRPPSKPYQGTGVARSVAPVATRRTGRRRWPLAQSGNHSVAVLSNMATVRAHCQRPCSAWFSRAEPVLRLALGVRFPARGAFSSNGSVRCLKGTERNLGLRDGATPHLKSIKQKASPSQRRRWAGE